LPNGKAHKIIGVIKVEKFKVLLYLKKAVWTNQVKFPSWGELQLIVRCHSSV
jgi:hypothetical protein